MRVALVALLLAGETAGMEVEEVVRRYGAARASEPATGRETLRAGGRTIVLAPGLDTALVDGEARRLSSAVAVRNGRVVVPPEIVALIAAEAEARAPRPGPAAKGPRAPRGFRVVLDAGHGGMHTGGKSRGGLMEKDVTLDVSSRLRALLEEDGFEVVMTRTADEHFSADVQEDLRRRVEIANRARPDAFLSIHSNYHPTPEPRGFEVYVPRSARAGCRALAQEIERQFAAGLATENRGIKEAGFYVLRHTQAPAALVELEFISNPKGERELGSPEHRRRLAELLFEAVRRYAAKPR